MFVSLRVKNEEDLMTVCMQSEREGLIKDDFQLSHPCNSLAPAEK